jgi:transcriptional regulator with XRE-family HTH domain
MTISGKKLQMLRMAKGVQQKVMAEDLGIGQSLLSKYERDIVKAIPHYTMQKMADYLGVELNKLTASADILKLKKVSTRDYNVGKSDYSKRTIQPWDIWYEYKLNPWDADIIKRVLRDKGERRLDYEKIKHICDERIRQIDEEEQHAGMARQTSVDTANQEP